jgi:hypothetical protein
VLPQAAMPVVKVISNCADQTHPVVKSCPPRKAKSFSTLAAISHSVSEVESLNGARVGLPPSQLGYYSLELAFAKYRANLNGFNLTTLAMLDDLRIDQIVRHSQSD